MKYDQQWHAKFSSESSSAADIFLQYLITLFEPTSLVDIGAGFGHWVRAAEVLGVDDVLAVDGPWTDLSRIVVDHRKFTIRDLEAPLNLQRRFDLALTLEVAEHVSQACADVFVKNLTQHSDIIVFGAAIPNQGGYRHINEQWPSYWAKKFNIANYQVYDIIRPRFWHYTHVPYYYRQNTLLFVSRARVDLIAKAEQALRETRSTYQVLDIVHPEKFTSTATFENFSLKKLGPRLPRAVMKVIRGRLFG